MEDESDLAPPKANEDRTDGRRERSERSRRRIVDAMLDLINSGEMHPGAAGVANAAGVSLRTVFRHFEEMDSLFREMTNRLEAELLPIALTPWVSEGWRAQLDEMIERRSDIYRRILHLKVSASLRRFQSEVLMDVERRFVAVERARLLTILPSKVQEDPALTMALQMTTGFATWHQLVVDQGQTWDEAKQTILLTVSGLLAEG